jgi:hypothetical protein
MCLCNNAMTNADPEGNAGKRLAIPRLLWRRGLVLVCSCVGLLTKRSPRPKDPREDLGPFSTSLELSPASASPRPFSCLVLSERE